MDAQDEDERTRDGIVSEGASSLKDDELNNDNKTEEDVNERIEWAPQSQGIVQVPAQQPQGSVIHWESFLHVRSINVLLVENDDSTRHVVTALLRNSNYEVIEAANGLQAWKILEDLTNHIDLVLTEVAMPCLSGIGLLCKLMSHPIRKNIPVIMMSSHDSMGLVFKCLSEGAVDFLLKPIRKNELKILWQHIWRRCHSSSGSGSENESQRSVNSKSRLESDHNSGSNDGDYYGSTDLKVGEESDDDSDGQSSWTKQAVEVDISQAASPWIQILDCPESTCAQVVRANAINSDDVAKGTELVISTEENNLPILHATPDSERTDERPENVGGEYSSKKQKAVLSGIIDPRMGSEFEALREPVNILEENNKVVDDPKELPVIELRGVKDIDETVQSDHNVSRHFELSAISRSEREGERYNRTSNAIEVSDGITELRKNLEFVNKQSRCEVRNNEDTGSTTNELSGNPLIVKNKSEATLTINGLYPSEPALCPLPKQFILIKADNIASNAVVGPPSGSHEKLPIEHIHHHHHHHHHLHHFHSMEIHSSYRSASGSNNLKESSTAMNAGGRNVKGNVGLVGRSASVYAGGSGSGKRIEEKKSAQSEAGSTKFREKRKDRCF